MLKYTDDLHAIVDHTAKHIAKTTITSSIGRNVIAMHTANDIQKQLRDAGKVIPASFAPVVLLLQSSHTIHATPAYPSSSPTIDGLEAASIVLNQTAHNNQLLLSAYELLADILEHLTEAVVQYRSLQDVL